MGEHIGPMQHTGQVHKHIIQFHHRLRRDPLDLRRGRRRMMYIPFHSRQAVEGLRRLFEALVFLQTADELHPRVFFVLLGLLLAGQEDAGFDLGEGGGHHQILTRQFELAGLHHLHIGHVLVGDLGHIDIQNINVLPPDKIQQQVQRAFEGLKENLQGIRGDI